MSPSGAFMTLIVVNDLVFLQDVEAILNLDAGMLIATNRTQALLFVTFIDFSVAIVDLDLSSEDSFDVIRSLRAACPVLPIITISGVYSRYMLESAKMAGAEEFLEKPATAEWKPVIERLRQRSLRRRVAHN
jgi:DNA-binding NtrC family response regulator